MVMFNPIMGFYVLIAVFLGLILISIIKNIIREEDVKQWLKAE